MSTVLSTRANCGYRDRNAGSRFDEASTALPLSSSRKGGSAKVGLVEKLSKQTSIASIW